MDSLGDIFHGLLQFRGVREIIISYFRPEYFEILKEISANGGRFEPSVKSYINIARVMNEAKGDFLVKEYGESEWREWLELLNACKASFAWPNLMPSAHIYFRREETLNIPHILGEPTRWDRMCNDLTRRRVKNTDLVPYYIVAFAGALHVCNVRAIKEIARFFNWFHPAFRTYGLIRASWSGANSDAAKELRTLCEEAGFNVTGILGFTRDGQREDDLDFEGWPFEERERDDISEFVS